MEIPHVNSLSSEALAAARSVAEKLGNHGVRGWIVGGAVRDLAVGRSPKDIDMASAATPDQIEAWFEVSHLVGRAFGTVVIRAGALDIQLTTFREERGYSDQRRPDEVEFGTSLEEDARRRDFTCNAMYLDPLTDELFDPEGGLQDLEAGLLRCVGDPAERFREDGLRLLRLARLAARFGLEVEPRTLEAALQNARALEGVSAERVLAELVGMLAMPDAAGAVGLLIDLELLPLALPGWSLGTEGSRVRTQVLGELAGSGDVDVDVDVDLRLAALFGPDLSSSPDFEDQLSILAKLKPSKKTLQRVTSIVQVLVRTEALLKFSKDQSASRAERIRLLREPVWPEAQALGRAWCGAIGSSTANWDRLVEARSRFSPEELWPEPLLRAKDMLAAGAPAGPRIGEWIAELEDAQLNLEVVDPEAAHEWLSQKLND